MTELHEPTEAEMDALCVVYFSDARGDDPKADLRAVLRSAAELGIAMPLPCGECDARDASIGRQAAALAIANTRITELEAAVATRNTLLDKLDAEIRELRKDLEWERGAHQTTRGIAADEDSDLHAEDARAAMAAMIHGSHLAHETMGKIVECAHAFADLMAASRKRRKEQAQPPREETRT